MVADQETNINGIYWREGKGNGIWFRKGKGKELLCLVY